MVLGSCGGRSRQADERAHLAEVLTARQQSKQLVRPVGMLAKDLDVPVLDDVDELAHLALPEQHFARRQLDLDWRSIRAR